MSLRPIHLAIAALLLGADVHGAAPRTASPIRRTWAQAPEEVFPGQPTPDSAFSYPGEEYPPHGDFIGPEPHGAPCGDCCQRPGGWATLDYLLWWSKGQEVPVLVTTSPPNTPAGDAGVLGLDSTDVLFGGERVRADAQSGSRLSVGRWLDCGQELGIGGNIFGLGDGDTNFSRQSNGIPILARPFFNADTQGEDAVLVAFPNIATGAISVQTTGTVYGAEAFVRKLVYRDCNSRCDLLAGYQFSRIDESLSVRNSIVSLDEDGEVPVGTIINARDSFRTQNEFHGTTIGFMRSSDRGCWSTQMLAKVGIGFMNESVIVSGSTAVTTPGDPTEVRAGGLLTQASNIGTQSQDALVVVPELGFNLAYHVTCNFDLIVGYTFIYWSSVVQPGDQIDRVVSLPDANGVQDTARPAPLFIETDYWVQGLNFGAQWRW